MKNQQYVKFILILLVLVSLLSGLYLFAIGNTEEATRVIIQWTAKVSTILFMIAFGSSAFQTIFKDKFSAFTLKYRAYFGLAFGIVHTTHLIALIWLQYYFHPVFNLAKKVSLFGGGLAYAFMFAMMVTTFPFFRNKMSAKNWRRLHLIGGYWILILFIRTYFNRVTGEQYGYGFLGFLIIVLILRIATFILKKRKARQ